MSKQFNLFLALAIVDGNQSDSISIILLVDTALFNVGSSCKFEELSLAVVIVLLNAVNLISRIFMLLR
jgi:hypothetical protein